MTGIPPPKRRYSARNRRRRDVDQAARALRIKKAAYAMAGGAIGALAGWFAGFGVIPGFIAGALLAYWMTSAIEAGAAALFGKIYNPSALSTPHRREYSRAEALRVRGQFDQAVEAYEVALSEFPEDPEPYLRIARIYRDDLGRHDEALFWFKRARSDAVVDRGRDVAISREIIDLYCSRMGQSARAVPELARLADRYRDEALGQWARAEIERLKREVEDGESE